MTISPLFVANRDTLDASLRLSAISSDEGKQQVGEMIELVSIRFHDFLGSDRIATIKAIAYVEGGGSTPDSTMRAKANRVEVAWVKWHLLTEMPALFVSGGAGAGLDTFNEEGHISDFDGAALRRQLNFLNTFIKDALPELKGDVPDNTNIKATTISPTITPVRAGKSIALSL